MGRAPELHFRQSIKVCYLDSAEDTVDFLKQLRIWEKIGKWFEHHSYGDVEIYNQFFYHIKKLKSTQYIAGIPDLEDSDKVLGCFLQYSAWARSHSTDNIDDVDDNKNTKKSNQFNTETHIHMFFTQPEESDEVFCANLTATEKWIFELFKILPYPLTVIYDPYYVDRVYRDEFYRYYSHKHFTISRNCRRLTFLNSIYSYKDLLSSSERIHQSIERNLIGMVVLKPTGSIGRTLIDPFKICLPSCYVRTTKFEIAVMGRIFSLNAFPTSGQDREMMTCAEVNVWQIMEYLGTRYREYKVLLPGEMLDCLKNSSEISILPSDGLTAEQEAYIFMSSGLSPRVYYNDDMQEDQSHISAESNESKTATLSFEDTLHIFVESGIPVLLNLKPKEADADNHSATCIGHECKKLDEYLFSSEENDITIDKSEKNKYNFAVIPSWRQYEKYVFLEDHSLPYRLVDKKSLRFGDCNDAVEWEMESLVVPLYKHVFMSVDQAYEIFIELFKNSGNNIVESLGGASLSSKFRIVSRIFLTTSRAFKDFRIRSSLSFKEKGYYSEVDYPKFLWICEYGTPEAYCKHKIQGEFVLDATASNYGTLDSVVTVRCGGVITYRAPNDDVGTTFYSRSNMLLPVEYAMFEQNNLKQVNNEEGRRNNV